MEWLKHHFSQLFFFVVEIHPYLKKVYTSPLPPGIAALFFMLLPGAASFYSWIYRDYDLWKPESIPVSHVSALFLPPVYTIGHISWPQTFLLPEWSDSFAAAPPGYFQGFPVLPCAWNLVPNWCIPYGFYPSFCIAMHRDSRCSLRTYSIPPDGHIGFPSQPFYRQNGISSLLDTSHFPNCLSCPN